MILMKKGIYLLSKVCQKLPEVVERSSLKICGSMIAAKDSWQSFVMPDWISPSITKKKTNNNNHIIIIAKIRID